MAFRGIPFDSKKVLDSSGIYEDRQVFSEDIAKYFGFVSSDGICLKDDEELTNQLLVEAGTDSEVILNPGTIKIQGRMGWITEPESLFANPGGSLPRIDSAVIELNLSTSVRGFVFKIVEGEESSNPEPPTLIRTPDVWQLGLGNFYRIANSTSLGEFTDTRLDSERCGVSRVATPNIGADTLTLWQESYPEITNLNDILYLIGSKGLMFESEWVEGSIIPVSKGGTGKNIHTSNSVLTGNGTNAVKNVASANGAFYATGANGAPKFGTLPVAQGGTGVTTEAAIGLKAYPVGAVYISYNSKSPAELFGGTWTPITGVFPYFNAGTAKGGSNTHTLIIAEMPSHNHKEAGWNISYKDGISKVGASGSVYSWGANNGYSTDATGGGGAHNNMPAYQTFYAWRRTA